MAVMSSPASSSSTTAALVALHRDHDTLNLVETANYWVDVIVVVLYQVLKRGEDRSKQSDQLVLIVCFVGGDRAGSWIEEAWRRRCTVGRERDTGLC